MESQDLREEVEWEARRVAAAFGVEEWREVMSEQHDRWSLSLANRKFEGKTPNGWDIGFVLHRHQQFFRQLYYSVTGGRWCCLASGGICARDKWEFSQFGDVPLELMARGLFRLGFEDPAIWEQLPPLTAHEKLELRLSLPREFWLQKWLEEESGLSDLS